MGIKEAAYAAAKNPAPLLESGDWLSKAGAHFSVVALTGTTLLAGRTITGFPQTVGRFLRLQTQFIRPLFRGVLAGCHLHQAYRAVRPIDPNQPRQLKKAALLLPLIGYSAAIAATGVKRFPSIPGAQVVAKWGATAFRYTTPLFHAVELHRLWNLPTDKRTDSQGAIRAMSDELKWGLVALGLNMVSDAALMASTKVFPRNAPWNNLAVHGLAMTGAGLRSWNNREARDQLARIQSKTAG